MSWLDRHVVVAESEDCDDDSSDDDESESCVDDADPVGLDIVDDGVVDVVEVDAVDVPDDADVPDDPPHPASARTRAPVVATTGRTWSVRRCIGSRRISTGFVIPLLIRPV